MASSRYSSTTLRVVPPQRGQQSKLASPHKSNEKISSSGALSHVSTPSTAADSLGRSTSSSSFSILGRDATNMKNSFALAVGAPEEDYMRKAAQILTEGRLTLLRSDESFLQAMTRQGVLLCDFDVDAKLSGARKVSLLAAVLQERDTYDDDGAVPLPAEVHHLQLVAKREESLERVRVHRARNAKVAQIKHEQADQRHTLVMGRAASEQARSDRVKARFEQFDNVRMTRASSRERNWMETVNTGTERFRERIMDRRQFLAHLEERHQRYLQVCNEDGNRRRARSEEREKQRQDTYLHASELLSARVAEMRAFLESQDNRLQQNLQERKERRDQASQRLRERFSLVESGVERAHEDAADKAKRCQDALDAKFQTSEDHQEDMNLEAEERQRLKDLKQADREHQRDRIARIKENQRQQHLADIAEDTAIFAKCRAFQVSTSRELGYLVADEGFSIGAIDLVESTE